MNLIDILNYDCWNGSGIGIAGKDPGTKEW